MTTEFKFKALPIGTEVYLLSEEETNNDFYCNKTAFFARDLTGRYHTCGDEVKPFVIDDVRYSAIDGSVSYVINYALWNELYVFTTFDEVVAYAEKLNSKDTYYTEWDFKDERREALKNK